MPPSSGATSTPRARRLPRVVRKYLDGHAEPGAAEAATAWGDVAWQRACAQACGSADKDHGARGPSARPAPHRLSVPAHLVMVPAFAEGTGLVDALASLPAAPGGVAIVVVANRPHDATAAQVARHVTSVSSLNSRWPAVAHAEPGRSLHAHPAGPLVLLDVRVPRAQGVGVARKIGCDVALQLWAAGRAGGSAPPWIHMGDADARWPADLFAALGRAEASGALAGAAALVRPFTHAVDAADLSAPHRDAALRYEIRLRHHVLGLRYARSPYAYQAIGSTISVHAEAYAAARGVPRRPAAEDFYLLNKLAKLGRVAPLPCAPTELSARVSDRVPFGTGAAMTRALLATAPQPSAATGSPGAAASRPQCYDPALFELLRVALSALTAAVAEDQPLADALATAAHDAAAVPVRAAALRAALSSADPSPPNLPAAALAQRVTQWVRDAFEARRVPALVARVRRAPAAQRTRQLHDGLDAFATLKLMHAWRARGLPDVPVEDALARAPFCPEASLALAGDGLAAACAALAAREASSR